MNLRNIAKALGRKGGLARAKRLTAEERQRIAAQGGHARRESRAAAQRVADNFRYLESVIELQGGPRKVKRLKTCNEPLPRRP